MVHKIEIRPRKQNQLHRCHTAYATLRLACPFFGNASSWDGCTAIWLTFLYTWQVMHLGLYVRAYSWRFDNSEAQKEETSSGEKWCQTKYLFILCWNPLTKAHGLPVLIHLIILLIHPFIENISVQNPFCMNLKWHSSMCIYINSKSLQFLKYSKLKKCI